MSLADLLNQRHVWLVELFPDDANGNPLIFRFTSDTLYFPASDPDLPGASFERRLNTPLAHESHMWDRQDSFFGLSRESWGGLEINNGDRKLDDWVNYQWKGRIVTVKIGKQGLEYGDFVTVYTGPVRDLEQHSSGRIYRLFFRDAVGLDHPLEIPKYAGDNGIGTDVYEGGEDLAGTPKPSRFGHHIETEAPQVNTLTLTYQLSVGPIQGNVVAAVKTDVATTALTNDGDMTGAAFDGWVQDASTVGHYITDVSRGLVKLGGEPGGNIVFTFDGRLNDASQPITTHSDLIKHYASRWFPHIEIPSFAAHDAAAPGAIRFDETESDRRTVLSNLLQSCGSYLGKTRTGSTILELVEPPALPATVTIPADQIMGVQLRQTLSPISEITFSGEGQAPVIGSSDPAAEPLEMVSYFANDADREAVAASIIAMRSSQTQIWDLDAYMAGLEIRVGDVIAPAGVSPFDGSRPMLVIGIVDHGDILRSKLTLWG